MFLSASRKACFSLAAALVTAAVCVCGFSSPSRAQGAAENPPGRVGRLALIDGTVSYHTADQNYWQAAQRNYPVTTGQSFWTEPNAHAAIDVAGNRIYLDSSTELDVAALDDATAQFSVPQGAVFLVLRAAEAGRPYAVQMARAAVTLGSAGRYEVIAGDPEHPSQVTVLDGSAHVSGNGFDLDVRAGETALLSGEQNVGSEVRAAGSADRFVAWAEAQEQELRAAPAVASAMTGAAELGAHGRWARAARYGDIWYPDVPAGWAPYREGYWAWVEPWSWTWIDADAWGFAPFHYGRWLMIDDRWAWIPGDEAAESIAAIYAPALVTFFTTSDLCAWVPLAPGEAYVPPYAVALSYFHAINAAYVPDIRRWNRITTERTRINAYVNQRALTAVPRPVVSASQPVAPHARAIPASRLANARPALSNVAVRPGATTAGVSPSVARRFGIAGNALAAAHTRAHAPGPPIHALAPSANARLVAPHALPPAAPHATPSAAQPQHQPPALAQPGVAHHLPGSPVGHAGPVEGNRAAGGFGGGPAAPAPHAPAAPETAGRGHPSAQTVSPHPTPPVVTHAAPNAQAHRPAPESMGRIPAQSPAPAHHAPPPVAVHRAPPAPAHIRPPPAVHAAPHPATIGRAPPPHAVFAPPHPVPVAPRPAPPPVVHAAPPAVHAAPPATIGRALPPAVHAPPAAAPGRHPGH